MLLSVKNQEKLAYFAVFVQIPLTFSCNDIIFTMGGNKRVSSIIIRKQITPGCRLRL